MNKLTLSDKQFLFLKDSYKLMIYAVSLGFKVTYGETYRPQLMQNHYKKIGKSKTLKSLHIKKLAIDLNFFINGKLTYKKSDLKKLGEFWENLSPYNVWGGNFVSLSDTNHFQRNEKTKRSVLNVRN